MVLSTAASTSSYKCLEKEYLVQETIGSGGFGKVKRAVHVLTGDTVAIKVIDKRSIGDDLPRVTTELRALKLLSHQNICRLYQHIETADKIFFVLELCSGGEMFDYIIKKDRLPEPEARHFFRQLVSAISFVHERGFAHRDLKPENLLLTDDLQLKLIDFGLCANPETGLNRVLETCCGSPAYAAPELIKGNVYFGNEADIWSMGVLLYALLCGFLPFEDDNLQVLYQKITKGDYEDPPWLSDESRILLKSMLQVDPKRRITIDQLRTHPWLIKGHPVPIKWRSIYDQNVVDEDCAQEVAQYYDVSLSDMIDKIKEWNYDYLTATYFILLNRKRRRLPLHLPNRKRSQLPKNQESNVTHSPTIHASLECGLDRSGIEDSDEHTFMAMPQHEINRELYTAPLMKEVAPITPVTARIRDIRPKPRHNDENMPPPPPPIESTPTQRPKSVYVTPQNRTPATRTPMRASVNVNQRYAEESAMSKQWKESMQNDNCEGLANTNTPENGRSPRTKTRTPQSVLHRRMFASVERKVDRVINMLTPRRNLPDAPATIRRTKTLVNVSTTNSTDPHFVMRQLVTVFEQKGISCDINGWRICGKSRAESGRVNLTVELEVVMVDRLNMVGVRRKRLNGDAFMYKRVCEQVLNLECLAQDA